MRVPSGKSGSPLSPALAQTLFNESHKDYRQDATSARAVESSATERNQVASSVNAKACNAQVKASDIVSHTASRLVESSQRASVRVQRLLQKEYLHLLFDLSSDFGIHRQPPAIRKSARGSVSEGKWARTDRIDHLD